MTDAFLEATLVATLLAGALLLARGQLHRRLGSEWSYALWLLPAIPAIPFRLPELPSTDPAGVMRQSGDVVRVAWTELERSAPAVDLGEVAMAVWLLVAAFLLAGGLGRYLLLQRCVDRGERIDSYRGLEVIAADVPVPLTLGILRPRIAVPIELWTSAAAEERALILEHESVHAERRDVAWNLLAFALLCLHWINPVAWLAYRAMRRDQELSCDARVTGKASRGDRGHYARLLLEVMARQPVSAAPAMAADLKQIEERIMMIWKHREKPATAWTVAAVLAMSLSTLALRAGAEEAVNEFTFESDGDAHVVADHPEGELRFEYRGDGEGQDFAFDDDRNVTVDVVVRADSESDALHETMVWVAADGESSSLHEDGNVVVDTLTSGDHNAWAYAYGEGPMAETESAAAQILERAIGSFSSSGDMPFGEGVLLEIDLSREGLSTRPKLMMGFGNKSMIEIRSEDGDNSNTTGLELEVRESSTGTVQLNWAFKEQSAGQWVTIAEGGQHVNLGEATELTTGMPGVSLSITAIGNPHE